VVLFSYKKSSVKKHNLGVSQKKPLQSLLFTTTWVKNWSGYILSVLLKLPKHLWNTTSLSNVWTTHQTIQWI